MLVSFAGFAQEVSTKTTETVKPEFGGPGNEPVHAPIDQYELALVALAVAMLFFAAKYVMNKKAIKA